jgi:hypothetical protein
MLIYIFLLASFLSVASLGGNSLGSNSRSAEGSTGSGSGSGGAAGAFGPRLTSVGPATTANTGTTRPNAFRRRAQPSRSGPQYNPSNACNGKFAPLEPLHILTIIFLPLKVLLSSVQVQEEEQHLSNSTKRCTMLWTKPNGR